MESSYEIWWNAMERAEKIYWLIAVPFTAIFFVQLILTFIGGGDTDHITETADHDTSFDHDHGIGFQFLSVKNLIGFFTIFGWTGIAMLKGGHSIGSTVLISTISGLTCLS